MNKIRVIDLLNKIANGEEVPKEIKYDTMNYYFRNYDYKEVHGELIDEQTSFIERINFYRLNDEVEIIEEEKEIEKISNKTRYYFRTQNNGITKTDREALDDMFETTYKTIDKIIDELNKIKKEGK